MPDEYKYKAFISYSHADRRWAKWLHRTLETYRPPGHLVGQTTEMGPIPARLAPVFRDTDDLPSSPDLSGRIRAALTESHTLIIICSPSSAKSLWVDQEIRMFQQLGRAERIFALIVAGDPVAANSDADCFPPALRIAHDNEGNALGKAAEPIAADARKEAGGRSNARLKLIAGLLGVGLDDLAYTIAVEELARVAAQSRSTFADRFQRLVGIAPLQYLTRWRMRCAHEWLTSGGGSVASIAERCGYDSEAAFAKVFKRFTGVGPGAARRQARAG